ncbi:hypothetical protein G7Y89_g13286 [Cudoniella acicularis]|uniref:Uncharacterized protein n=1 Tax=Cudoniella acicularis TaxID=354080 RepID=A0A8H4R8V1_9HELO|nr:hypothetical protein G7Y89_g13286 [Cudoniella acicularis]
MKEVLRTFLQCEEEKVELERFGSYQAYHDRSWLALKSGHPPEADSMEPITHEHIQMVVKLISDDVLTSKYCQRKGLGEGMIKNLLFQHHSEESMNRTIDLALRLWLVLHIRDDEFSWGTHSIQWDDQKPLQTFIAEQFPKPRMLKDLSERMFDFVLPDNFTMVKLKRYSGIKVHWTDNLSEHLDFDKDHRILKNFPLKYYVNSLRRRFGEAPSLAVTEILAPLADNPITARSN